MSFTRATRGLRGVDGPGRGRLGPGRSASGWCRSDSRTRPRPPRNGAEQLREPEGLPPAQLERPEQLVQVPVPGLIRRHHPAGLGLAPARPAAGCVPGAGRRRRRSVWRSTAARCAPRTRPGRSRARGWPGGRSPGSGRRRRPDPTAPRTAARPQPGCGARSRPERTDRQRPRCASRVRSTGTVWCARELARRQDRPPPHVVPTCAGSDLGQDRRRGSRPGPRADRRPPRVVPGLPGLRRVRRGRPPAGAGAAGRADPGPGRRHPACGHAAGRPRRAGRSRVAPLRPVGRRAHAAPHRHPRADPRRPGRRDRAPRPRARLLGRRCSPLRGSSSAGHLVAPRASCRSPSRSPR